MTKVYTLYHHTQQQQKKMIKIQKIFLIIYYKRDLFASNFLCDDRVCSQLDLGALCFGKTGYSQKG